MKDFLLQAYKDRKELKTTYIFNSWSFKSRFLKEDFCCFSLCASFGILVLHIKQSRAAEFPLFLFTGQPGADAVTPGFPDFFMTPGSAHHQSWPWGLYSIQQGQGLLYSSAASQERGSQCWEWQIPAIKWEGPSLKQLQQLGNHSIKSCSWCYKTTEFSSAEGNDNTEH